VSQQFSLEGKVALITGGSRGIGLEIARAFVDAGGAVMLAARRQPGLDEARESLAPLAAERGVEIGVRSVHTGQADSVDALVGATLEQFGGVDIVVNNAATNPHFGPFLDATDEQWAKTFDVNVLGYYRVARACVASMRARGGGRIINIASIAGLQPQPAMGVYCVSKAAVVMMTRVLAMELASDGITANAIAPGFVRTKFSSVLWQSDAVRGSVEAAIPQGRLADPAEISGAALYLASAAGSYTTGTVLEVDGGQRTASGVRMG
jgi:NAD(P)-dependent dehydrogenase (short-subunit alcohol dehydrogenase family)